MIAKKLAGFLATAILLFFQTSCIDLLKNQVTVYPVLETKLGFMPLSRIVYKVFPESQKVIYWTPGIDEAPKSLPRCAVRDRLHWECEFSGGSCTLTMLEGILKEKCNTRKVLYVAGWKWWTLRIKGFFS